MKGSQINMFAFLRQEHLSEKNFFPSEIINEKCFVPSHPIKKFKHLKELLSQISHEELPQIP